MNNDLATIPAGTTITDTNTTEQVTIFNDIHVDATVIPEDTEVSIFTHNGREYTVWSNDVIWDE